MKWNENKEAKSEKKEKRGEKRNKSIFYKVRGKILIPLETSRGISFCLEVEGFEKSRFTI